MGEGLWLRLVGPFAVHLDGTSLPVTRVGSRKARTVLAVLAVESGYLVATDRIVHAVWGDAPPRRPAENLLTLISRLRSALGRHVVGGGRGGYRLGDGVLVDLYEAAVVVSAAERRLDDGQPAHALAVLRTEALPLLDGASVLADQPDALWAEPAHRLHADLLRRARLAVAEAALRTGPGRAAVAAAEAVAHTDPLDEAAHRVLMLAYDAVGEPARALAAFERLRSGLASTFGVDPPPGIRALHVAILRRNAVGRAGHAGVGGTPRRTTPYS